MKPRQLIVLALVGMMLLSGCAGWGTDGPADQNQSENETNQTNETAAPNETNATDESNASGENTTNASSESNAAEESGESDSSEPNSGGSTTEDTSADDGDSDSDDSAPTESQSQSQDSVDQSDSSSDSDSGSDSDISDSDSTPASDSTSTSDSDSDSETTDGDGDGDSDSDPDSSTEEPEPEPDEPEQYASPSDLELDEINHMGGEAGPDYDQATFVNTHDELSLPVGGWAVETNNQHWDGQVMIPEGTVLGPGETVTVHFPEGEKALAESGGVLSVYDADGNLVGEFNHVGSPSAPNHPPEEETTSVSLAVEDSSDESVDGVHGASVSLSDGEEEYTGTTDEAGAVSFGEVLFGQYELVVQHEDYETYAEAILVDDPEGHSVTVALNPVQEPDPSPNETNESAALVA